MKVLILADIDDFRWKYGRGQADVVVSCGDVSDELILEAAEAHGCSATYFGPPSSPILTLRGRSP